MKKRTVMLNDYILRSDALAYVRHAYNKGLNLLMAYISAIPAADVEPVIRCKDCKNSFMCDPCGIRCTKILNNGKYMPVEGDFFCAYGAKMDAEPPEEKRDD